MESGVAYCGRVAIVTILVTMGGGCAMLRLRENVAAIGQTTLIGGTVSTVTATDKPICVALYTDEPGQQKKALNAYQVIYQRGQFSFRRPSGDYYLFAFEDANEDGAFQNDERVGWYGSPSLLKARPGVDFQGLQIVLRPPAEARRELPQLYASATPRVALEIGARHLGEVATLDSPRFDPETGALGMWEPLTFMERYGAGLFFLQPYAADRIPVVFVHGMGGTPRNFQFLIGNLDRTRFQPWVVQYPTAIRLSMAADGLANYLAELQVRHRFKRVIVVAHSMGGLVARGAINRLSAEGRTFVSQFVSISSPWEGHPGAASGVEHSPVVMPSWYDMAPGSPFLKSLHASPLPAGMTYYLLFSYQSGSAMFVGENNDGTLPMSSMLDVGMQDAAVKVLGFNESHAGILDSPAVSERLNSILKNEIRQMAGP